MAKTLRPYGGRNRRNLAIVASLASSAPARTAASPCALANVRPITSWGNAPIRSIADGSSEKSMYASSRNTMASDGSRATTSTTSARVIGTPVGLFGLVRNTTRVCGVMAARSASSGKAKPGSGATSVISAWASSADDAYMSNAGWTMTARCRDPSGARCRQANAAAWMPSSSPLVRATWPGATPSQRAATSCTSV